MVLETLRPMGHLEEERLFQLTLGQLDGDAEAQALAHLAGCDECRGRHERLSSIGFSRTVAGPTSDDAKPDTRPERPSEHLSLDRGATLGRYVVLEKLGAGGMGDVFGAYDPHLDRKVAVKLLRVGSLSAEEGKARLLREAQAMARLQHPNVIAVHDVGTLENRVFIAMEFVDGETVSEWIRGDRTWRDVVELFLQAGSGLAAAHRAGLVHRDFKPDNVLVGSDGRPRVLDFGLARQATVTPPTDARLGDVPEGSADTPLTQPLTRDGAVMGTPGYMAPEQLAGLATDARSDQFAFCVALYEALYGQRPFGGGTLKQHAQEMASSLALVAPQGSHVPPWVHSVLVKGLSVQPSDRWPDMDALLRALRPRERRSRSRLFVAGLVVFATAGIGYGLWTRQRLMVCGGQEARLAGVWDMTTRGKLKSAFLATGQPFASEAFMSVEKTLDGWALDWVNAGREACEATKLRKVDSEELMELKLACLEERRQSLESTVTLFAQADRDVVMNAAAAAKHLESPRTCTSRRRRAPQDEADRKAEQELRGYLSRAQALFDAGKYTQAAEALKPGLRMAAPPRVLAEAWLLMGRIQTKRHEPRAARLAHLAAGEQALKGADESAIAVSLSRLYANEGFDEPEPSAEVLGRLAQAAAARVPGEWEVQVELASNSSYVEIAKGRFVAARADLERALSLQREHLPAEHPDIASTLNNIGIVLTRLGQGDEAIRSYQQSLAIHEAVEGPRHPNTATSAHNLAVTYRDLGRLDDARTLFERAVSVRREALGVSHADTLNSELSLAKTCVALGDFELAALLMGEVRVGYEAGDNSRDQWSLASAEAELQVAGGFWKEALAVSAKLSALAQKIQPGDSPLLGAAALVRGRALTGLGNWAEAHRALAEAQRLTSKSDPKDQADLEDALGKLAHGQGNGVEAAAHFERALALREKSGFTSPELGNALLELGRCRVETGRGDEAAALGERAERLFSAMQVKNAVPRARWLVAEGQWLSGADGGASPTELEEAAAALPWVQREGAHRWLKAHGLTPDAGAALP